MIIFKTQKFNLLYIFFIFLTIFFVFSASEAHAASCAYTPPGQYTIYYCTYDPECMKCDPVNGCSNKADRSLCSTCGTACNSSGAGYCEVDQCRCKTGTCILWCNPFCNIGACDSSVTCGSCGNTKICPACTVATPTPPPGSTPPPIPTQPPTCNNCPAKTWCAPNATECSNAGGYVLSNPCPYCSPGTVHCCTPEGGDDDDDCGGEFWIRGPDSVCIEDGAWFKVRQHQESRLRWIPVRLDQPGGTVLPYGVIVCQAGDFIEKDEEECPGGDCSCFWDTMHIEEAENYSDFNQDTIPPNVTGPYPTGVQKLTAVYSGSGDCEPQDASMYTNLQYCPLPCPTSLSAVCNANGTVKFDWTVVTGAVSYTLRVNKEPFPTWTPVFVPPSSDGKGDFTANPTTLSLTNKLEVGFWWEWSIHPIRAGEVYSPWQPNVCYAPLLNCPVILKSCNDTCTLDSECATNYCYPWSFLLSACRNESCPDDLDCVCPIPTPTPTFVPTPTPIPVPSWFQTTGGDIQSQGDITSLIPACATIKYLSKKGGGGSPGVVGYAGSLSIGAAGAVSETLWQAKTAAGPTVGFDYLANRLRVNKTDNLGIGDIDISSLADGVYYSSESRNIVGSFPGGKKIVIFIDGTADIRSNLVVPAGSFLAIIASGDLTFSSAVIQAQGFFLAGGTLEIYESSDRFEGQGSFVGLGSGGISLLRDLGNNCNPAEAFVERPDFFINAPDEFKLTNSYFKEIEP